MGEAFDKLRRLCETVFDIVGANEVLSWDEQTYMPPGGGEGRARQHATLERLAHEHFVSEGFGEALEAAEAEAGGLDPDSDQAGILRRLRRDFDKKRRVPAEWVEEFAQAQSLAFQVWRQAKLDSNFKAFLPELERIVRLRRTYAEIHAPKGSLYDALLDDYEPGMRTSEVKAVFDQLRPRQVHLVRSISESKAAIDESILRRPFDLKKQWDFGLEVIEALGYDFRRGRQDEAPHPFTITLHLDDVRITNWSTAEAFGSILFASMHEAGHAMYEQGISRGLNGIPTLSGATLDPSHSVSLGVHESQSRMMENLVGRSRAFWRGYYPRLQAIFPSELQGVELEAFYRAINRVKPTLIRVEADEATYNLHIMLRVEIEIGLIEGALSVADLPEIWREKTQDYLGLTPPDDRSGVLQDVHWSDGYIGYFPTYAMGNLIASQLWQKIRQDLPDLDRQIEQAQFRDLLAWLRENLHRHGAKYEPMELLRRITGQGLTAEPYLQYLSDKYSEIYELG
jgi:carboxypeptidase Taq